MDRESVIADTLRSLSLIKIQIYNFEMKFQAKRARNYSERPFYKAPFFAKPGEVGDLFGYSNFDVGQSLDADFAIIDIETSGLSAQSSHILEIAILRINQRGRVLNEFQTLIMPPDGSVGRPDIHQIHEKDLKGAPSFAEVAGNILEAISECIIVAHNAKFEEMFLASEFDRARIPLPKLPAIDTMWLAQMEIDTYNYKLPTVLNHYGHTIENAHTALGDVKSIAKFLPTILEDVPEQLFPVPIPELPKLPLATRLKARK